MQSTKDFKRETLINKILEFEISRLKTKPKSEITFKASLHDGVSDEDSREDEIRFITIEEMERMFDEMDKEDERKAQELALISKADIRTN